MMVRRDQPEYSTRAYYFAEMVRQSMYERYQDEAYTRGFRVYTTLSKSDQDAAYAAVRKGVMDYDRRHGYRGAEGYYDVPQAVSEEALEDALQEQTDNDDLYPAAGARGEPEARSRFIARAAKPSRSAARASSSPAPMLG